MKNFLINSIILVAIVVIALVLFFTGFRIIPDGYMGVEIAAIGNHRVLPNPLPAGWYWRRPLMIQIVKYNTTERVINFYSEKPTTADKKNITIGFNIYFQLQADKLVALHKRFGNDYSIQKKVETLGRAGMSRIVKDFTREQVFGNSRATIIQKLSEYLKKELAAAGVKISNIIISKVSFPNQYRNDIAHYYPAQTTMQLVRKQYYTNDKKRFFINLQLYYHIEPKNAEFVHNTLGTGFVKGYLVPKFKSIADKIIVGVSMDMIYNAKTRDNILKTIRDSMRQVLLSRKIKIDDIAIESIEFEPSYQKTLDDIQQAKKRIEKMQLIAKLKNAELAIEINLKEKEQAAKMKQMELLHNKEQAQKLRDAEIQNKIAILHAESIKKAELLKAEGKAEALYKVQKALANNPNVLRYLYIDKISDKVKVIVVPDNSSELWAQQAIKSIKKKGD